ncbi:hypothetical protein NE237_033022 [Protea cynaroides]|uniref:RING-type E3 ubiquitin transferase n=1 Tax=Protea cynaroides TaxID=273540 RepID=A0A9Q0R484_9MAGN|nr:hypothetical protein NE237_033022 [Protea cynaroides]
MSGNHPDFSKTLPPDLDYGVKDDQYNDFDNKILFTAITSLVIVIVIVVLLHIYARCYLGRQTRRRRAIRHLGVLEATSAAQLHTQEPPKTGLDPSVIASIPVFTYQRSEQLDQMECIICLSSIEDGEKTRILPNCKHMFHVECIDMWLSSHSTCPICRTGAEPQAPPSLQTHQAEVGVAPPPTAPQLEEGTSEGSAQLSKVGGSFLRLSSFKRILSRDRSDQSRVQAVGEEDLERQ